MVRADRGIAIRRLVFLAAVASVLSSGCAVVPHARWEESQRLSQTLRAENARLKDQVLALQGQNRDYADRAVDDLRRLAARDQAIERLERSVQAYQEDRDRLGEAYEQLTANLGQRPSPTGASRDRNSLRSSSGAESHPSASADRRPKGYTAVDDEETGQ